MAMIFLVLAVLKTSAHLEDNMDLRFYDESYYLTQGLFHNPFSWLADYSPFYSLFYKGLSYFESDAISLYYLNYRVWAWLFSSLIFWILYQNKVHPAMALIWATTALCAQTNYLLWPKAGHFAMVGVGLGLLGLRYGKFSIGAGLLWVSGIAAMLAWVRPEFALGAVVGLLLWLTWSLKNGFFRPGFQFWSLIPGMVAMGFSQIWGLPIGKSGRGNVAFGQHFVHNLGKMKGAKPDPLYSDWVNWREIFSHSVGNPDEMISTFFKQPGAILSHFFYNGKQLVSNLPSYFFETLVPVHWLGFPVFFTLGLLWFLAEQANGFNGLGKAWKSVWPGKKEKLLFIIPLAIPSLAAGLLFQPRPHYILPLFPILVWAISIWMGSLSFAKIPYLVKTGFWGSVLIFGWYFLPDSSAFFRVQNTTDEPNNRGTDARYFSQKTGQGFVNINRIRAIKSIQFPPDTRIFDGSTGLCDFLGNQVISCGKVGFEMNYTQLAPFETFLQKEKITHVLLAKTLEVDHFFGKIAWIQALKTNPELLGWKEIPLGSSTDRLFEKIPTQLH